MPTSLVRLSQSRQVSKITNGEPGATVTVICAMGAAAQYVPPMMTWSCQRITDTLMLRAPPGSVGAVSDNRWIDCSFSSDGCITSSYLLSAVRKVHLS